MANDTTFVSAGGAMIAGNHYIDPIDIPGGRTFTLRGAGGWNSGGDGKTFNGTMLCARDIRQRYLMRFGYSGPSNAARAIHLRDAACVGFEQENDIVGLEFNSYNGASLANFGFFRLGTGLYLNQAGCIDGTDDPRRMVSFHYRGGCIDQCRVGVRTEFLDHDSKGRSVANACTVFDGLQVTKGEIAFDIRSTGRGMVLRDCYAEAQATAGVVLSKGELRIDGGYFETNNANLDDDPAKELVPSIAVLGGTLLMEQTHHVTWLYIAKGAMVKDLFCRTKYVVVDEDDPMLDYYKMIYRVTDGQAKEGQKYRLHTVSKPWLPGEKLEVARVKT